MKAEIEKLQEQKKGINLIFEKENVKVVTELFKQESDYYSEIAFYSDLGEDVSITIWHDGSVEGFIKGFSDYYECFDPEEHAELYISCRGKYGIPNSIRALLDDADKIDTKLKSISDTLLSYKRDIIEAA